VNSSLYSGLVWHERRSPVHHAFIYRMMMVALDLDEVERGEPFGWLFSKKAWRPYRYDRKDLHRPEVPCLKEAVVQTVCEKTDLQIEALDKVLVLTQPRTFGHCFNPVSFYYVYASNGGELKAVLAEINNTPWNERYSYVVEVSPEKEVHDFEKSFHVSPFMPMDQNYRWSFSRPEKELKVQMENHDPQEGHLFDAGMALSQEELTSGNLLKTLFLFPFNTLKTLVAIYWHALRLRIKGAKYYTHSAPSEVSHA
jgi:uncharacterized protein